MYYCDLLVKTKSSDKICKRQISYVSVNPLYLIYRKQTVINLEYNLTLQLCNYAFGMILKLKNYTESTKKSLCLKYQNILLLLQLCLPVNGY